MCYAGYDNPEFLTADSEVADPPTSTELLWHGNREQTVWFERALLFCQRAYTVQLHT